MTKNELLTLIQREGDKKYIVYRGYRAMILRPAYSTNSVQRCDKYDMFHLNGYVAIPKGHPWYELDYNEIKARDQQWVDVHGGLTFGRKLDPHTGEKSRSCWIGFDCAHAGDINMLWYLDNPVFAGDTYKDMRYVEAEIKRLIDQAIEVETPQKEKV